LESDYLRAAMQLRVRRIIDSDHAVRSHRGRDHVNIVQCHDNPKMTVYEWESQWFNE